MIRHERNIPVLRLDGVVLLANHGIPPASFCFAAQQFQQRRQKNDPRQERPIEKMNPCRHCGREG